MSNPSMESGFNPSSKAACRSVHVGMDVHKTSIAVAVAYRDRRTDLIMVEDRGAIAYESRTVHRLSERLEAEFGPSLHFVYEAGPCGTFLWRCLQSRARSCEIIAPSMIPKRPGDRVKTDRRDARTLAQMSRAGYLTPIWVPDATQEAIRDLFRSRRELSGKVRQQKQRIHQYAMRHGHVWQRTNWTKAYRAWLRNLPFPNPLQATLLAEELATLASLEARQVALERELKRQLEGWVWEPLVKSFRALRGIDWLTGLALAAELGDLRRFRTARQFMNYLGLTPSETSSGDRRRTGGITKTGNRVVRSLLVESAWTYRFPARQTYLMQRKAEGASEHAGQHAWEAQKRLCGRYRQLSRRGKDHRTVCVAIARELAGFVWAIGCHELNRLDRREPQ